MSVRSVRGVRGATSARRSKRAKSSLRVLTSFCGVTREDKLVNPLISANKMLPRTKKINQLSRPLCSECVVSAPPQMCVWGSPNILPDILRSTDVELSEVGILLPLLLQVLLDGVSDVHGEDGEQETFLGSSARREKRCLKQKLS